LEQARGSLTRHSAAQALQALDAYASTFPGGALQVEAAALRVEAIGQSGNRALAAQLADAFLVSYPTSPLAARVRAFASTAPKSLGAP
jgi:outer membrane protein assembly factor BamD (BamD/ComL family)